MFEPSELKNRIALNTRVVRLRRESKRVLLYTIDPDYHTTERMGFLPPAWAIFLALLDGRRTQLEILEALRYTFDLPSIEVARQSAKEMAEVLTQNFGADIFCDAPSTENYVPIKEYDPLSFVIEAKDVDVRGTRLDAPLDLNYIVTQACYRRCIYCYAEIDRAPIFQFLSAERFAELMDEARELQINSVLFGGGEPFCRKDIVDLIGVAIDAGIWPFLSTKAYLSKEVCKKLKEINVPFIQVSIDSHRENVVDFLTGSKGYSRQIMKTIKNLKEVAIPIRAKMVVTPFNVFDIPDFLQLLFRLGIIKFHFVRYGRSAFRHRDNLFVDDDALQYARDEIELFKDEHPGVRVDYNFHKSDVTEEDAKVDKDKRFSNRAICAVGRLGLTILPDGRAFACEQLPTADQFCFGDLKRQSIREVSNSEELRKVVMPPRDYFRGQACFDCESFEHCHTNKGRCMRNAFILYGNAYAPDPYCPKAPPAPRQE
ncbi:MAG: radical SAM protein [Bacteroidota bacterium]